MAASCGEQLWVGKGGSAPRAQPAPAAALAAPGNQSRSRDRADARLCAARGATARGALHPDVNLPLLTTSSGSSDGFSRTGGARSQNFLQPRAARATHSGCNALGLQRDLRRASSSPACLSALGDVLASVQQCTCTLDGAFGFFWRNAASAITVWRQDPQRAPYSYAP